MVTNRCVYHLGCWKRTLNRLFVMQLHMESYKIMTPGYIRQSASKSMVHYWNMLQIQRMQYHSFEIWVLMIRINRGATLYIASAETKIRIHGLYNWIFWIISFQHFLWVIIFPCIYIIVKTKWLNGSAITRHDMNDIYIEISFRNLLNKAI